MMADDKIVSLTPGAPPPPPSGSPITDGAARYMGDTMTLIHCVMEMSKGDHFAATQRLRVALDVLNAVRPEGEGPF